MTVLAALAGADAMTFEELFRLEYSRVANVALRILGDRAAAEDVAQEAFVSFARRGDGVGENSRGWLCTAAVHGALNELRTRRRRDRREERVVRLVERSSAPDPFEAVAREEAREFVRAVMKRLPERTAALLALRYAGLPYREIAIALRLDEAQIGTLLNR
ncbi:MAG: sigma-70 family RNA polymerase sigma factor, partial [Candidatus Eremiobacteraeota bacterium]|nr:sigma-70 family RNA polymerase sigma factor [Candidatus Eremiobacteraeota bacterium]